MQDKSLMLGLAASVVLALGLAACGGDDAGNPTPNPVITGTVDTATPVAPPATPTGVGSPPAPPTEPVDTPPTALPPVETPDRGDGISAVQAVIDAARGGDIETLRSFVRATGVACVTIVEGIGGPPQCREGEPEGTVVQVVQVADCEGHLDRVEELQLPLYESGVPFVNAFGAPSRFAIAGDTILVFQASSPGIPEQGVAIVMDGGAITGFYNGCGQTVAQLVDALGLGEPIAVDAGTSRGQDAAA